MMAPGQMFAVGVARDRGVEALSLAVLCGAVACAGGWRSASRSPGSSRCSRRGCGRRERPAGIARSGTMATPGRWWASTAGVVEIEPPVVHLAHRMVVVLEVAAAGRADFLVFSSSATPRDDLRRLRVRLRAGGLSR